MNIAFIPCRLKSNRLPNKGLLPIHGIPSIIRCVINAQSIPGIDKVIIATSNAKEDDSLVDCAENFKVEVVRGSETDVLDRFLDTIGKYRPDNIIRITGDCPLVSAELGEIIIKSHIQTGSDASFTLSKVALGIAFEIYKASAIEKLRFLFPTTEYSEYLIYYFLNNPEYFELNIIDSPPKFIQPWRLTLDEENDLELLDMAYKYLSAGLRPIRFSEVEHFFANNPNAAGLNIHNVVKYRQDEELVKKLKEVTTYRV